MKFRSYLPVAVLTTSTALGCRTTAVQSGVAQQCAPIAGSSAGAVPTPTVAVRPPTLLAQRVDALTRSVAPRGARFSRYLASGFLTERQSLTTAVDLSAGDCVAIVAYASAGIGDLDARVYDEAGELLVEDVEPDSHPTVQICAQEPRRVYHVVQAFDGDGAFVIAQYDGEHTAMDALITAVGGRPGTAVSTRANSGDGERRLLELRATLGRRGFIPANDPMRLHFAAAGTTAVPLAVSADRCFTVAAFSDAAAPRLALHVFDSDGTEIARDGRTRGDVSTQFCPGMTSTVRAVVTADAAGSVVVQSFAADAATFGGGNTLWLGERVMGGVSNATGDSRLESARARWSGEGFTLGPLLTVPMAPAESREVAVSLEPNRCSLIAAGMGRGLARISSALYAEDGELISRGNFADGLSTLVHCTGVNRERVSLRLRADAGGGEIAWGTALGSTPPSWSAGLQRTLADESIGIQVGPAADGWVIDGAPERVRLTALATRTRDYTIRAGSCTRAILTVGRTGGAATLTVRNNNGEQLAVARGEGTVRLTYCSTETLQIRLQSELSPAVEADGVLFRYTRSASADSIGRGP